MTTVLICTKSKKIVADRQRTHSYTEDRVERDLINKIRDIGGGRYMVASGNYEAITECEVALIHTGCLPNKVTVECTIAVICVKGNGLLIDLYETKPKKFLWFKRGYVWDRDTCQGDTTAISFGSGSSYAWGAYKAGVSPEDAVRAASMCDDGTSYEIDVVTLGGKP